MSNLREVLASSRSRATERFRAPTSGRRLVSGKEAVGASLALATLLTSCSPKGEQYVTPTPEQGQTINLDRSQIRVLTQGAEGLTPQENNILSAYSLGFQTNPFIAESGYVIDNVSVVQAPGVNTRGENSTLEMAVTSARDQDHNLVYFFQFRNDNNEAPQQGAFDTTVTTYIYSESNVRMTETDQGIVVDIYGTEIQPTEDQEGQRIRNVLFYSMIFDASSPHNTLSDLMRQGTLLETRITNPVSLKQAVINEGRTPGSVIAENGGGFTPVSYVLRQGEQPVVQEPEPPQQVDLPSFLSEDVLSQLNNQTENRANQFFTAEGEKLFITIGGERVEIDLETFGINTDRNGNPIENKNDLYGHIVTVKGVDGNYYAFNPDYSEGWFEVIEASADVNSPTEVTLEQFQDGRVLMSLLLDPEVNVPFPEGTVYRGISMNDNGSGQMNPVYLRNSPWEEATTSANVRPTEWVSRYFKLNANGNDFYFNPFKWLDTDVNNPNLAEFKLLFLPFGGESKGEAFDYQKYLDGLSEESILVIYPIISADPGYFDNLRLETLPLANTQPSLAQLYELSGNNPGGELSFFKDVIEYANSTYGPSWQWEYSGASYNFRLPPEIQKMLLPFLYSLQLR